MSINKKYQDCYCWCCGRALQYFKNVVEMPDCIYCGCCFMNKISTSKESKINVMNQIDGLLYAWEEE